MNSDPREEVDEELRFHIEQRTRDYIARGMTPDAAREAAAQRFGDSARVREACTSVLAAARAAEKRRAAVKVSRLDVKLGLRMFAKYPGLSLVAVGGMAIAIAFGAGYYSLVGAFLDASVPLEGGDRVVMIRNQFISGPDAPSQSESGDVGPAAFDVVQWRGEVKSLTELSAFRDDKRNLITEDGHARLVRVAEITASGLRLTRVAPLLGRTLLEDDERAGALPVIVIGYEQWQRQFAGDARILGRTVRLGDTPHTIVGVMPEGFAFPISHGCWVPLRLTTLDADPGAGPPLIVFARIADGYALSQARAELAAIGQRMAAAFPQSHGAIRTEVIAYAQAFLGIDTPGMQLGLRSLQFGAALLLLVVAVNVGVLVYARTATRFGEIAVRTALGASRGRVIMQLFVEALVLSSAAAALGLTLLAIALGQFRAYLKHWPDRPDWWPYWLEPSLSAEVIVYVGALAVVAAVVIGVLPALKATGKRVQAGLQQFSSRAAPTQLGRAWTALIVLQVTIAVAALPGAIYKAGGLLRMGTLTPAPATNGLLKGTLHTAREAGEPEGQFADRMTTLMQRLQQQPEISAVTFAEAIPGTEGRATIEPEDDPAVIRSHANLVATNLFDVFGVRVLAGRGFTSADVHPSSASVIVDQAFADRLVPGGSVIGRRIRFSSPDGASQQNPWMEIVGVVPVFSSTVTPSGSFGPPLPSLYKAAAPGRSLPVTLIAQVRNSDPTRYGQKLQELAAAVDPAMEVEFVAGVVEQWEREAKGMRMIALIVVLINASVLLLSAAGIHAMMSFTVTRRRREIGIRVALGADGRRVLMGIFGRASAQIGAGVVVGLTVAGILESTTPGGNVGGTALFLFPAVGALMFTVGLLAAAGPARRGLTIEPTEALRTE
jgi:putative ABC transport system permease protein